MIPRPPRATRTESRVPYPTLFRADVRGFVRPVLDQQAFALVQQHELFHPVDLVAREENHVMRALDRLDRNDLHEAEMLDQRQQVLVAQLAVRRKAEALALQEQPPGREVVDDAS